MKKPCFPKHKPGSPLPKIPEPLPQISESGLLEKIKQSSLTIGGLGINFQRTCRVPQGKINSLPAGLGSFPLYRVNDFKQGVPRDWQADAYFFPMYKQEAMWINFQRGYMEQPKAVIIGAGNINAISGKPFDPSKDKLSGKISAKKGFDIKLEIMQNYLVVPPQPWIDGWKAEDGKVYQFVAAEMGSGETVEGQITGEETIGGIQVIVYNPLPGQNLIPETRPNEYIEGGAWSFSELYDSSDTLGGLHIGSIMKCCVADAGAMSFNSSAERGILRRSSASRSVQAMGLGRGGEISQKIYPDPYGIGVWDQRPREVSRIYMVSSSDFQQITGNAAPPTPVTYKKYQELGLPWFELYDEKRSDSKGYSVFKKLKPVSGGIVAGKVKVQQSGKKPSKEELVVLFKKLQ